MRLASRVSRVIRPQPFGLSFLGFGLLILGIMSSATAQNPMGRQSPGTAAVPPAAERKGAGNQSDEGEGSLAERINSIRKLLEADQQRLAELTDEREELEAEFERASSAFEQADKALTDALPPPAENEKPTDVDPSKVRPELAAARTEARDRFDRVIARRRAVQSQIETLTEKVSLEKLALERSMKLEAEPAAPGSPVQPAETSPSNPSTESEPTTSASEAAEKGAEKPAADPSTSLLGPLMPVPVKTESKASAKAEDTTTKAAPRPADQSTSIARRQLQARQHQLRSEQEGVELLDRSIEVFERDLTNARQLLTTLQTEYEANRKELAAAESRVDSGSDASDDIQELRLRTEELREEFESQSRRIVDSEQLLDRLRKRKEISAEQIGKTQAELDAAERQLWFMESPLAPRRIYTWFAEVGPKLLGIAIAIVVAWWAIRLLAKRIASGLLWNSDRGTEFERQARAETLGRVFQGAGSMAVLVLGILALLQQTGIDVTVLLGGAAVIGAAIAFGSQNLIRDYFSGFMILAENQYSVGNVVRIGDKSGVVEDISLRLTVLRDEEGVVHFIPHNTVATVSNLTHGWSRAVFAIGVGYQEDVDQVIGILKELAQEIRRDPDFAPKIIADAEMQGVDALGDSAVVVKFLLKTRPLQQWSVKREMLRRIKKRFDQEGIEIPFPHQTIYYRSMESDENEEAQPPMTDGATHSK